MRKAKVILFVLLLVIAFSLITYGASSKAVELTKINDQIWVHTSYEVYNGYPTPSNGLVVITPEGLIMIDTCWNNESTKELLEIAKEKFNQKFILAIITHGAHGDCIGGIDTLFEEGIEVISTELTAQKAMEAGFKQPLSKLESKTNLNISDVKIETYYPGEGHTQDNITVWFPDFKILFAGCIVKAIDSNSLGNITDANVKEWPNSLRNILKQYPDISIVIPGHGNSGNADLINHTLKLFN